MMIRFSLALYLVAILSDGTLGQYQLMRCDRNGNEYCSVENYCRNNYEFTNKRCNEVADAGTGRCCRRSDRQTMQYCNYFEQCVRQGQCSTRTRYEQPRYCNYGYGGRGICCATPDPATSRPNPFPTCRMSQTCIHRNDCGDYRPTKNCYIADAAVGVCCSNPIIT